VRLRPERTDRLLGLTVPADEQQTILQELGFDTDEAWDVTVPTWRARDVTREVDVIEEVARVVLDRVPFTRPLRRHVQGRLTREQRLRRVVEDVLVGAGFSEAYTWSLQPDDPDPAAIRLPDPMTSDQAVLRTTLLPGLVEAARTNVDAGNEAIALFEIARVYLPSGERLPDERWRLGGIAEGGFAAAKGAAEAVHAALHLDLEVRRASQPLLHPGKAAETDAGVLGELHPAELEGKWGVFELDLATLFGRVPERVVYEDVVTYPALRQDIAVVVDEEVEAGALVRAARDAAGPHLREARVFDVYRGDQVGEGRKSVAIHLAFQSPERTLSDDDAAELRGQIVAALAERFGGELRA
jgi:phenylalanyl-tRNA synthetase beta chain